MTVVTRLACRLALLVPWCACGSADHESSARDDQAAGASGRAGAGGATYGGQPAIRGGQAGGGGSGNSAGATELAERADRVFSHEYVLEYRLAMAEADATNLEEHGNEEKYVPAELTVRGGTLGTVALGKVGIRHKGDTTLQPCWTNGVRSYANQCARLSYKLSFDEYVADTRLFGLKRLHLNVSYGDPSRLRELLAHGMFADFGIKTPRAAPALLYVNDSLVGLFIAVEDVDGRFTAMHFPGAGDGNLYKEAWPQPGRPDSYFLAALRTNEDQNPSVADMQQFSAAVAKLDASNYASEAPRWINVEELLRYLAVDRAIKNWDGVTAFYNPEGPHNFFFYHDDGVDPKFHLIPWDFNGAGMTPGVFQSSDPYMDEHPGQNTIPNINVAPGKCTAISVWNVAGDPGMTPPGCDPLLRYTMQTQWSRWVEIGRELLDGPMSAERVQQRIDALRELIAPAVELDPLVQDDAWSYAVGSLPGTIAENRTAFEALLAEGYHAQ